ncbi:unnamed protein product [Peniophora sp. CBMAI 1063]|nr:unnamed protein product [Peniophora sp. CBMAI 1063]
MLRLPIEVLEYLIDGLDRREDLLSFALTCMRLRDIIIPSHLPYRRVVISMYFQPFFDFIRSRPNLAGRVRELTLVNASPYAIIPRAHAFRRKLPESRLLFASGYDDEFLYDRGYDGIAKRPFDVRSTLDDALFSLPRLRRLQIRGDTAGLPLERIMAFHHDRLEGFSADRNSSFEAQGGDPFPLLSSDLWMMSELRTFEISMALSSSYWDSFCAVLDRSPMLETLAVPLFSYSTDDSLCHLPRLKHLRHVSAHSFSRVDSSDAISQRLFYFLSYHPTVEEVHWTSSSTVPLRMPRLPAVKRMFDMSHAHVLACTLPEFSRHHILGPDLDTVTMSVFPVPYEAYDFTIWDWGYLGRVFPTTLRCLHVDSIHDVFESYEMLDALSRMFPNLEELLLPIHGTRYAVKLTERQARSYPIGRAPETMLVERCPLIREIHGRFPRSSSVAGVDIGLRTHTQRLRAFHSSSTGSMPTYLDMNTFFEVASNLRALREQYPLLRQVNGWHLDTDLSREVIMDVDPGWKLYRSKMGVQVVLTRESICVRYAGSRAGSQPIPLQVKRPHPIPRTYYWNG